MRDEKWMSKKLRETTSAGWKFFSFESCGIPNVPDLHGVAKDGRTCWIELKVVASKSCSIPFRLGQPAWIEDYARQGGSSWVLVLDDKNQELWLLRGSCARWLSKVKLEQTRDTEALKRVIFLSRQDPWTTLAGSL